MSYPIRILLLACLFCPGCDTSADEATEILNVESSASGPLIHVLDVTLSRPAPISITYAADGERALVIERSEARQRHDVVLTRLAAATTYEYEVRADQSMRRGTISTGALPESAEAIVIDGDLGVDNVVMLYEVHHPDGFSGALIADRRGRVVWIFETSGALTGSTVRMNGHFVFVDLEDGLVEVHPDGTVVDRLPQTPARSIHHDVVEAPDGELLFLTTHEEASIVGDAVWSWRAGSEPVLRWSAFDHLSPDEDWGSRSRATDWLHANSLSIGPRGNVVVSFNFLNQIISLAPDFDEIEWRLGGVNAAIRVDGDAEFSGQHTAAELHDGHVLMFDNGIERSSPYSRSLELRLDGDQATALRDLRPNPANWSRAVSSAFRTADGLTFVTYGLPEGIAGSTGPIETYVVGPDGETIGRHHISGLVRSVYRGTPLHTIAGERLAETPR